MAALVLVQSEIAEASWTFEFFGGSVYNVPAPLSIEQSGYKDLKINAHYETRPFLSPQYYCVRAAKWKANTAWEIEFIHHKLFLKNKPSEVQFFSITHGYNMFTANRAWNIKGIIIHTGAGVVIPHPETTVRNRAYSEKKGILNRGYYISGTVVQIALGKNLSIRNKLFFIVEGKATGSYTHIPIKNGDAYVENVAFHGVFGLGYRF